MTAIPTASVKAATIAGIESEEQRELSCGYRYTADMSPGTYRGQRYDGVMRQIPDHCHIHARPRFWRG